MYLWHIWCRASIRDGLATSFRYSVPRVVFVNKLDRQGADFFAVVQQIKDRLGARAVPIQIPIGSEENFSGVIDLINSREIVWQNDDQQGLSFEIREKSRDK